MNKNLTFRRAIIALAMLLLCGIFLQSCTEEMPILVPRSKAINGSVIVLNIRNKAYTIRNENPGFVYFTNITPGSGNNLSQQYGIAGSDGSPTNPLDCIINFNADSVHAGNYILSTSQVNYNNVTYTTSNPSGNAKFKVNQLNAAANTTSGSFAYYLYDSVFIPTDSIYVSGTFSITK
ncbi:hypothetical protein [Mucilaginibacter arboris]|uniref:Uncharacterized protein n=1 Tax=Mucilaginibacter arboris TaxID=2682090 RepID=A0A7K1SXB5_9SPHI|nr:hypothetical protein [Mucilaginibacter arboris]MVN21975.1 hypothetical protein [Mucilaginibacter arboris]